MHKAQLTSGTYLITERPGQGALRWFLERAAALLCEREGPQACGMCGGCRKVKNLLHPDLHVMVPVPSSAKDPTAVLATWREAVLDNPYLLYSEWMAMWGAAGKQGNMAAAQVRTFQEKAALHAFEGHRKVFLIWLAEYLGKEGNILLKTLEEPPEGTFFFLITQRPDRVLPTIRSRCLVYRMPTLPIEDFVTEAKRYGVSEQTARAFYGITRGSIGLLRQLQNDEWEDSRHRFEQWQNALKSGDRMMLWTLADQPHAEGREGAKTRIDHWLLMLQQGLDTRQLRPYDAMTLLGILETLQEEIAQNIHIRHAFFTRSLQLMEKLSALRQARLHQLVTV